MAIAQRSVTLQASPDKLWALLSSLENWPYLFNPPAGWVSRSTLQFETNLLEGKPAGFVLKLDGNELSLWDISEWTPPKLVVSRMKRLADAHRFQNWLASPTGGFSFKLTPIDSINTRVDLSFEISFNGRIGAAFEWIMGLEQRAGNTLDRVVKRLEKQLEPA